MNALSATTSVLALLALSACHTNVLEPEQRRAVQGIELREVRVVPRPLGSEDNGSSLAITLGGDPEQLKHVEGVLLGTSYADACWGILAEHQPWGQQLVARWEEPGPLWGSRTVEIQLDDESGRRCIRIPLASDEPGERLRSRGGSEWLVGWRFGLDSTTSPHTSSTISTSASIGGWLGPLRLSLASGIGLAGCSDELCPRDPEEDTRVGGRSWLNDVEVEAFLVSRRRSAVTLGLRPGLRLTWFKEAPGHTRYLAFTPALTLKYWATPEVPFDEYQVPARKYGGGFALELLAGLWQDLDDARPTGAFFGLNGAFAFAVH
jgi:hypothetical protein